MLLITMISTFIIVLGGKSTIKYSNYQTNSWLTKQVDTILPLYRSTVAGGLLALPRESPLIRQASHLHLALITRSYQSSLENPCVGQTLNTQSERIICTGAKKQGQWNIKRHNVMTSKYRRIWREQRLTGRKFFMFKNRTFYRSLKSGLPLPGASFLFISLSSFLPSFTTPTCTILDDQSNLSESLTLKLGC